MHYVCWLWLREQAVQHLSQGVVARQVRYKIHTSIQVAWSYQSVNVWVCCRSTCCQLGASLPLVSCLALKSTTDQHLSSHITTFHCSQVVKKLVEDATVVLSTSREDAAKAAEAQAQAAKEWQNKQTNLKLVKGERARHI